MAAMGLARGSHVWLAFIGASIAAVAAAHQVGAAATDDGRAGKPREESVRLKVSIDRIVPDAASAKVNGATAIVTAPEYEFVDELVNVEWGLRGIAVSVTVTNTGSRSCLLSEWDLAALLLAAADFQTTEDGSRWDLERDPSVRVHGYPAYAVPLMAGRVRSFVMFMPYDRLVRDGEVVEWDAEDDKDFELPYGFGPGATMDVRVPDQEPGHTIDAPVDGGGTATVTWTGPTAL